MPKSSILIVEDTIEIQNMLKHMLESAGYSVTAATTAEEAAKILAVKSSFSAMLLDYNLPGMTGYELLETLPEEVINKIPVIVISGNSDLEFMERPTPVVDLVPKPFNFNHLLESIERVRIPVSA